LQRGIKLSRSENTKTCHGEAFFAAACFFRLAIPSLNSGDGFVAQNAPRNDRTGCVCGQTLITAE